MRWAGTTARVGAKDFGAWLRGVIEGEEARVRTHDGYWPRLQTTDLDAAVLVAFFVIDGISPQ